MGTSFSDLIKDINHNDYLEVYTVLCETNPSEEEMKSYFLNQYKGSYRRLLAHLQSYNELTLTRKLINVITSIFGDKDLKEHIESGDLEELLESAYSLNRLCMTSLLISSKEIRDLIGEIISRKIQKVLEASSDIDSTIKELVDSVSSDAKYMFYQQLKGVLDKDKPQMNL